ncbi:MAG: hypothetical protein JRF33_22085 [Deltaproteobacteria bacterium]|nr:hypothetical protein [Deltaproteobacteria bacterium]
MGTGAVPTSEFNANHAMLLLKVLTRNLFRGHIAQAMPSLLEWRLVWLRRVLFCVSGRLLAVPSAAARWREIEVRE